MTVGQRWRLRRDIVIFIASRQGVSQRMLADVFDLPRSRIAAILKLMEARGDAYRDGEGHGHATDPAGGHANVEVRRIPRRGRSTPSVD